MPFKSVTNPDVLGAGPLILTNKLLTTQQMWLEL